jgi:hypothetical protein
LVLPVSDVEKATGNILQKLTEEARSAMGQGVRADNLPNEERKAHYGRNMAIIGE